MIKVLLCDNQLLTSEGLIAVLRNAEGIEIIGEGKGIKDIKQSVINLKPQIIIIDPFYSHFSVDDIKSIYEQLTITKILILTNRQQKEDFIELINIGVKHYVCKECSYNDIIMAIYATAKDEQFYCKTTMQTLFGDQSLSKENNDSALLSVRETEIIHLISAGMTNKEIAEKLFLSIHTVKTHRKNIIKKIGFTFKNAADLVLYTSNLND
ncbi:response regulator transcription factor [Mucilaginibacter sp. X4EP1]|uniref:response regulator transcription factor n=1 Tax=Mucilaginibacter sp. X4EP1 TaxID=2723092 RepID=UPI0021688A2C|nr:response regulator transcription factor [Mucilaginibacter sp. X4EP1]MCS3814261.1 two-component system NarL family response regulator [Mucilaginibacter sp. X4EP1]